MIVIIEGIDKVGKSTLIQKVQEAITQQHPHRVVLSYKTTIKPRDKSDRDIPFLQYKAIFDLAKQNHDAIIIHDRSYITELVYSAVKRDYDAIDDKRYQEFLDCEDVLVIYLHTSRDVLVRRFKKENEEYVIGQEIDALAERYDAVLNMTKHKIVRIETTVDNRDEIIGILSKSIKAL